MTLVKQTTLVLTPNLTASRDTPEDEFGHHRKLFLTEQGYSYQVRLADGA
jgi:hypothetical protein